MLDSIAEFFQNIEKDVHSKDLFFSGWESLLRVILTTVMTYLLLLIILKSFGSRSVSSFSVYDLITTITIGSTISSILVFEEVTLINGIIAILLLLLIQLIISKLTTHWPNLANVISPSPKVVFLRGDFLEENMKKAHINKEEILAAIRSEAQTTSDKVYAVVLEVDGTLSVVMSATPSYEDEITKYLK